MSCKPRGEKSPLILILVAFTLNFRYFEEPIFMELKETELCLIIKYYKSIFLPKSPKGCDCHNCRKYKAKLKKLWTKIY